MKRILIILIVIAFMPMSAMASKLERGLRSRWLGAWVVMTVETYSNCSGRFTANRVNGRLVSSRGRQRFRRGELARVERIDAKRRRIDIFLSIAEPVLVPYEDGPFTLYNQANCKLELEVEVPRELVKSKDVRSLDRALAPLMKRFSDIDDAQNAGSWNQRERDAYPEGYDRTLAEHAIWQAERQNALVQTRLDDAFNKTAEITSRIGSDEPYLSGFARGVRAARSKDLANCSRLLAVKFKAARPKVSHASNDSSAMSPRMLKGYQDGMHLVYGLEMLRNLPECFVPVPDPPVDR